MCGRYKLITEIKKIIKKYPLFADALWDEFFRIHPELNRVEIFPGTPILAINNQYQPENLWWTIRDKAWDGTMVDAINAKAETVHRIPMFRDAFKSDRVLIPATGLYEWHTNPDGSKTKYEILFDEPIFSFGGVARDCEIKGETKRCGAIITTHPNEVFAEIHNSKKRQAVVIREGDYEKWLDPSTKEPELKEMMEPLPSEETHAEPV